MHIPPVFLRLLLMPSLMVSTAERSTQATVDSLNKHGCQSTQAAAEVARACNRCGASGSWLAGPNIQLPQGPTIHRPDPVNWYDILSLAELTLTLFRWPHFRWPHSRNRVDALRPLASPNNRQENGWKARMRRASCKRVPPTHRTPA